MAPSSSLIYRFYKVPSEAIHILKGIFECYEGMCLLSTVDRDQCIVQLSIAPDFLSDIEAVVADMQSRLSMHRVYDDIHHSLGKF